MEQEQDVLAGSSPVQDVNEESSSSDENVPFHQHPRFKELIEEKNSLREELAILKGMVEKDSEPQESELPDIFEDPKKYAEYVKQQAKAEVLAEIQAKQNQESSAKKFIDDQYSELIKQYGEIDEKAIGKFAIDYNIRHQEGGYNLVKAYELMRLIDTAKNDAKVDALESVKRTRTAPVSGGGSTKNIPIAKIDQKSLKGMSMQALIARLAKD